MKAIERIRGICRAPQLLAGVVLGGRYDFIYDQMPIRICRMSRTQRLNLLRSGCNLICRRLQPWSYPLHMQFELVNYCQLRCPVCPTGTREMKRRPRNMDPALFKQALKEAGPRLITMSLWGWGESLLHPELAVFLSEARRYNAAVLLSTNGQNLNCDEVIKAIIEHPPTFLIVALDGLTNESNSRFRVGAKMEPALQGVEQLMKERNRRGQDRPVLQMRFIVMKHNQRELPEAEDFARSHGFDMLSIRILSLIDSDSGIRSKLELTTDLADFNRAGKRQDISSKRKNYICMQPFWYPSLFADGTLVACEQDFNAQLPLGVLDERTRFADLWFGRQSIHVRRQIRDAYHTISFCRNCPASDRDRTDTSAWAIWLRKGIRQPVSIGG
ncbi:MAG: radical SAM protein [Acidobacteria bacterium]|nr:radical SAM protein [Acidobacteriota bacterium]